MSTRRTGRLILPIRLTAAVVASAMAAGCSPSPSIDASASDAPAEAMADDGVRDMGVLDTGAEIATLDAAADVLADRPPPFDFFEPPPEDADFRRCDVAYPTGDAGSTCGYCTTIRCTVCAFPDGNVQTYC